MLDVPRLRQQALRWSIFTGASIALFWTIRWLSGHEVPVVHNWGPVTLPFAISRWWDIAAGPLLTCATCTFIWLVDHYDLDVRSDGPEKARDWVGFLAGVIVFVVGEMLVGIGTFFGISSLLGAIAILVIPPVAVITGFCAYWLVAGSGWCIIRLWNWLTVRRSNKLKLANDKAA